jgi:hypothetical protein
MVSLLRNLVGRELKLLRWRELCVYENCSSAALAAHAQNLGVEASVRVASMMGEFASSMGAGSGLTTVRGASARMAMLASGVLAGIADALRAHTEAKEGK